MSKVSFFTEAEPCTCECHKGKWWVNSFLVHPTGVRTLIAKYLAPAQPTDEEVTSHTLALSREVLRMSGLVADPAKVEVTQGEDAENAVKKYIRENNPNLN